MILKKFIFLCGFIPVNLKRQHTSQPCPTASFSHSSTLVPPIPHVHALLTLHPFPDPHLTPPPGQWLDWRWLAICSSVPPTVMMVCMCFMPETPRYLLSRGKRREAEEALRFLRGPDAPAEWECARIEEACDEQVSEPGLACR